MRTLENKLNIQKLDVNYESDDLINNISDDEWLFIKQVFRSTKQKPKTMNDFKPIYIQLIKNITCNDFIKSIQKRDKSNSNKRERIYIINNELIQYHMKVSNFRNPDQ